VRIGTSNGYFVLEKVNLLFGITAIGFWYTNGIDFNALKFHQRKEK
jgi:hypothetical protein